jgi:6-phosphogluconolactonase
MTSCSSKKYEAALMMVASSTTDLATELNSVIVDACRHAVKARGVFTIALSGASMVGFLSTLPEVFSAQQVDPHFDAWHVILADERLVPTAHADSNMGALQRGLFTKLAIIPQSQIHGINQDKLQESSSSSEAVAADYEDTVRSVMHKSNGKLDMAVLGFGPDGHTCSLFPNHRLLKEESLWVASLDDSPKPPPSRITLTFPVLNDMTRHVVFCGAGTSKSPILKEIFEGVTTTTTTTTTTSTHVLVATMKDPAPFPCGAVRPEGGDLTWIVDKDAMEGVL